MLKYIGNGAAVVGIPPRDLDAVDIEKYVNPRLKEWDITLAEFIANSGIYQDVKSKRKDKKEGE